MYDHGVATGYFEEMLRVHNSLPTLIHEGRWLNKNNLGVTNHLFREVAAKIFLLDPGWKAVLLGKVVEAVKADIMPRAIVLLTYVTEADNEAGVLVYGAVDWLCEVIATVASNE